MVMAPSQQPANRPSENAGAPRHSLAARLVLQMALRIAAVVMAVSLLSYYQSIHNLEEGVKQQLSLFTSLRTQTESQWLNFLDSRLNDLRHEYLARYQHLNGAEPAGEFDRYFRMNDDGTGYPRDALYSGMSDNHGARYSGFSGGIANEQPMTPDRRLRLVLAQQMLFQHATGITRPQGTMEQRLPSIDFYFALPEKDLLVYWPGVPWYPDFKGGFDLATQGDFFKMFNSAIPYEARKSSWTGVYRDEVTNVWMVSFTCPIVLNGRNLASVGVDISLTDINYRLSNNRFEGATSLIMRRDGLLIAHPGLEQQMIDQQGKFYLQEQTDPDLRDLQQLVSDHPEASLIDDAARDRFVSIGKITGPDWLLITLYPKRALSGAAMHTVQYILTIGVISLLMEVALLGWILRRKVAKPLRSFVNATRAIAHGDMSVRPLLTPDRHDELGVLARAFLEMTDALGEARKKLLLDLQDRKQVDEQLRVSEERWKFALEGSGQGVWDWYPATNRVTFSREWKQLLGFKPDEIEEVFESWESRVHPDDKAHVLASLQGHLQGLNPYSVELRLRCKNGEWKWVLDRGMVVRRDHEGKPVRVTGTITDISDFKAIENELRLANELLELRVQERTRQLEIARQQAEVANETKSQFLANMSHDIRTPMNSIIGMTTLAMRTSLNDKQRDYLQKIEQSAQYLLGILNDILDISKIEAGKMTLEQVDFNLSALFDQLHNQLAVNAALKHLQLSFHLDPALSGPLAGDPLRLSQILNNLIGNAIKFTASGSVDVDACLLAADADGVQVKFTVRDTGIGLSEETMAHLFEPFRQADASTARHYGGTGLGLAICKQLVMLMNGEIGVDSRPGAGSTFWFSLRLQRGQALAAPVAVAREPDLQFLAGRWLLLVEDNRFNQQVARELLEQAGAGVVICDNGDAALARLSTERFDCVLMDVQMPGMDGYETTRMIRKNPALADQLIIAMTANARDDDRIRCREAGMNDFVSKPINPRQLFFTLQRWITKEGKAEAGTAPFPATTTHAQGAQDIQDTQDTPAVDLAGLMEMWKGNREKVEKYALLFLDTVHKDFHELTAALDQGDLQLISDIGHRAKSSALMLGAKDIAAHFLALEKLEHAGTLADARAIHHQLQPLLDAVTEQIHQALRDLPAT